MPFSKALARSEAHKVSARIWTQVTESISYDNRYTKHSFHECMCIYQYDCACVVLRAYMCASGDMRVTVHVRTYV